ncbi:MAG TPA: hypothetical protein VF868_12645 [Bacteroidia bacterium]|jgi:hypothetical protein
MNANYNLLPINEKAEILWAEGKFIEAVELNNFDVSLYSLEDQFFEIYYSVDNSRIEKISPLKDPQALKRYQKNSQPN